MQQSKLRMTSFWIVFNTVVLNLLRIALLTSANDLRVGNSFQYLRSTVLASTGMTETLLEVVSVVWGSDAGLSTVYTRDSMWRCDTEWLTSWRPPDVWMCRRKWGQPWQISCWEMLLCQQILATSAVTTWPTSFWNPVILCPLSCNRRWKLLRNNWWC